MEPIFLGFTVGFVVVYFITSAIQSTIWSRNLSSHLKDKYYNILDEIRDKDSIKMYPLFGSYFPESIDE